MSMRNLRNAINFFTGLFLILNFNLAVSAQIAAPAAHGTATATASLVADPPIMNFGDASINKAADLFLRLANFGTADLTITEITHANPSFVIAGGAPFTIAPGAAKTMLVSFIPALLGSQTDTLKIFSTGMAPRLLQIPLSGTGTITRLPELSVQTLEVQFDSALVGVSKRFKLRLYNRGAGNLSIVRATSSHSSFAVVDWPPHLLLEAGKSVEMKIEFKPAQLGLHTGLLAIESTDANENPLTLKMNGIGKAIPAPTLSGIAPALGTRLQTLNIGFKGTKFISGVSRVNTGAGITVNNVTVHRADSLTAEISIGADAATGKRDFSVTNNGLFGGGTSTTQSFTVINPVPVLHDATPNLVSRGETRDFILRGEGFMAGVTAVNVDDGIKINFLTVTSPSTLSVNTTIAVSAATGAHFISVINPEPGGGTSRQLTFSVTNPAPSLLRLTPSSGAHLQTLNIEFKGANFIDGVSHVNVGPGIVVNSVKVHRLDSLTANLAIAAEAEAGPRKFSVINNGAGGGTSGEQSFMVNHPLPAFASLNPASANRLQTLNVGVKGANFFRDLTTVNFGAGIRVNKVTVHRIDSLTANITITANADNAQRSVEISNPGPGGGTFSDVAFLVSNPTPILTSLSPTMTSRRQVDFVLTGSNFIRGVTTVNAGDDVVVNSIKITSATSMAVNVTIPAGASIGPRRFSVANAAPGGGVSGELPFTIINFEPTKPPLLLPANNTVISWSRQPQPIRFVWGRSFDGDAGDTLRYVLHIKGPKLDTAFTVVQDTSVTLNIMSRLKVDSEYSWGVHVSDGVVNVTWPDRFVFHTSRIITAVEERQDFVPSEYRLEQNYPNPLTRAAQFAVTTIKYQLPSRSEVTLTIYDVLGQEVATLVKALQPPGYYTVRWNGKNSAGKAVPGGVYIYRLRAGSFERVMKMTVRR